VIAKTDNEQEGCVYHENGLNKRLLGGRVLIRPAIRQTIDYNLWFSVDGIPIINMKDEYFNLAISIEKATSYLNAIEVNGLDEFIQNYKRSIEFTYNEVKELKQMTEIELSRATDESRIANLLTELNKIRKLLVFFLSIVYGLRTYMSAGLENEKMISVFQSVMDSIS